MAKSCAQCGHAMSDQAAFCERCGARVYRPGQTTAASTPGVPAPATASGTPSAAAMPEAVGALPWQTVASGEMPDVRAFIAERFPRALSTELGSLRTPAIALVPAVILDLAVSYLFLGNWAVVPALVRFVLGMALSVLGIRTARSDGALRRATVFVSRTTASVQLASVALVVVVRLLQSAPLPPILPVVIAILACFALTLRITALSWAAR